MNQPVNVAVLGATGLVGETLIEILNERDFPLGTLYPLASERSLGKTVTFRGETLPVIDAATFDFSQAGIGLFSAGASVSREYAPKAAAAGCIVVDNTSEFRYEDDIPLVVPEVNEAALAGYRARGIVANPNCSTIQLTVALKPFHDAVGLERIHVATYQAVSGAGRAGVERLARQTTALLNMKPLELAASERQIAFNALPHIDAFQDNGATREEMKLVWESRKILGDDALKVTATAVRIPVFFGHSEAVHIETAQPLDAAGARRLLADAPGVVVIDERRDGGYATAVSDAAGNDAVFVSRIREDGVSENGLCLWVVADNVRKGAALNSVQIAEILVKKFL